MSADNKEVAVLLLLGLTATFYPVVHRILLNCLENWIGVSGTAISWFDSYLKGRNFYVSLGDLVSDIQEIVSGVSLSFFI